MSTLLSVAESTRHDPELGMSWRNRHTLVNLQLIAEMQLQAGAEIGVLRAAVDFLGGVGLEGLTEQKPMRRSGYITAWALVQSQSVRTSQNW